MHALGRINMENKCIVFGHEHQNSLGQVRTLGERGIRVIAVILKDNSKITSSSKYVSEKYFVNSVEQGYDLIIKKWSHEPQKPFIFTSDDIITSYLDQRYDEIKDKFYFNNCGQQGLITFYMNKTRMCKVASEHGFEVPKLFKLDQNADINEIQFPVITKANASLHENWKDDSCVCKSSQELMAAIKKHGKNDIIVQEYIEKDNELCLEGYSYNDGNDVFIPVGITFKYLVNGAYAHYLNVFNFHDEELAQKVKRLLSFFKYNGVFEVEFVKSKSGKLYFLEINFRNSCWGYVTQKVGMSTSYGWIMSILSKGVFSMPQIKIKDGYTAMNEFSDFKIRVLGRMIGFREWSKEFKNCDCKYYYNGDDKKPFFHALRYKIVKTLFRPKNK